MKNMKKNQIFSLRLLTAAAASAILTIGAAPSASAAPDTAAEAAPKPERNWEQHREEWMKARLDKAARRLDIQPAQQSAWDAYAHALEAPPGKMKKLPRDADAATIARHRADMAADHTARLMTIADATANLQAVLTPEQRTTFNHMVRFAQPHGHMAWMMHHRGEPHHPPEHGGPHHPPEHGGPGHDDGPPPAPPAQ